MLVEDRCGDAFGGADLVGVTEQKTFVTAVVSDDLDVGCDLGVALDESADGGA